MADGDRVTDLTRRVAQQLRERAAALEVSRTSVSLRAGLAQTSANDVFRGRKSPTIDQLAALCAVMGLNPAEVLRKAQTPTHS